MPVIPGTRTIGKAGGGTGSVKYAVGRYDFAVDGGEVGDITLRGLTIPSGAIVTDALILVDTALTSDGSATVAIKVQGAADIQTAAAYNAAPWSSTGAKRATFTATTAPILTSAARTVVATVATAALTGGKFRVVVGYVEVAA